MSEAYTNLLFVIEKRLYQVWVQNDALLMQVFLKGVMCLVEVSEG